MPELSKLAKLIVHRQEQEKKNERLRIHKNRIENDKLQVQVTYLDWNKGYTLNGLKQFIIIYRINIGA